VDILVWKSTNELLLSQTLDALPGRRIKPFSTNIALAMNGKKKRPVEPHSTNVLDYPCTMSGFEKESLATEAKLKADQRQPPKRRTT
jgi:hypothetical protein